MYPVEKAKNSYRCSKKIKPKSHIVTKSMTIKKFVCRFYIPEITQVKKTVYHLCAPPVTNLLTSSVDLKGRRCGCALGKNPHGWMDGGGLPGIRWSSSYRPAIHRVVNVNQ